MRKITDLSATNLVAKETAASTLPKRCQGGRRERMRLELVKEIWVRYQTFKMRDSERERERERVRETVRE